jgi:hypothetical protein
VQEEEVALMVRTIMLSTSAAIAVVLFALAGVASADKPESTPAQVRLEPETGELISLLNVVSSMS